MDKLNTKIKSATKWSAITEIMAKLISPIVSIVLARLLSPEAFGVVATLTMIITFAEIFTDAGFQKYIIQHDFVDQKDFDESVNVAFFSNIIMSLLLWGVIIVFSEQIAELVGNPGLGFVLVVACISIPLSAFAGIQTALYRRDLNFKPLFKVRMASVGVPLIITIPLALFFRNYWALVFGTIAQNISNVILLSYYSNWKPRLFFSYSKLMEMLSFTIWSVIEAISIWLTCYIDLFILGKVLNQHYLGLYKMSSTVVGQIMGLITSISTPILFASLSRLQSDQKEFEKMFFSFQKYVALLVLPLSVGIYMYSEFFTTILLGEQWLETSGFIGLWGLTSGVTIVLSHYCSEVYRAKGYPKFSVLAQVLHIIVLCPVVLIYAHSNFETLYIARSFVRFELVLVNLIIMYNLIKISPIKMIINIIPSIISSVLMGLFAYAMLQYSTNFVFQLVSIIVCVCVYVFFLRFFVKEKQIVDDFLCNYIKSNVKRKLKL